MQGAVLIVVRAIWIVRDRNICISSDKVEKALKIHLVQNWQLSSPITKFHQTITRIHRFCSLKLHMWQQILYIKRGHCKQRKNKATLSAISKKRLQQLLLALFVHDCHSVDAFQSDQEGSEMFSLFLRTGGSSPTPDRRKETLSYAELLLRWKRIHAWCQLHGLI